MDLICLTTLNFSNGLIHKNVCQLTSNKKLNLFDKYECSTFENGSDTVFSPVEPLRRLIGIIEAQVKPCGGKLHILIHNLHT